ncbi:carboxylating nicotinate-nucleotide diphosphorylase [Aquibacillus sp. 3ASR75-11]|uniref:Probable nicotinate-nucleotide pyrophosphorylase [carboxylating] n=1 Tax=Terrihalobacillus insolitus TaxID=2950438 RepID=A0A9X4AL24_9BACI|nr:carboxylating nicotinate-nucleotide diphosphorylase [Terrihalobacillus insolitus]MDC3423429.1 carboxylating nicotinate-nucleotide diphosphorylase [Terrihalobacillus insolitus]
MNKLKLAQLLEHFFIEDIGERDVTSDSLFGKGTKGGIVFLAKDDGVFCGTDIIEVGFSVMDPTASVEMLVIDGETIQKGQQLAVVHGNTADLLKGERVVLNLIQHMSGIATKTREAVTLLNSNKTKICDTRKTTPGLRMLEKYAVTVGGGYNHRFGLYDAVMIKDNHIAFAGSIKNAVEIVRNQVGHMVKIEVETESKEQVLEAVQANADVIMFDNQSPSSIKELIQHVPTHIITETSGGIKVQDLPNFSETGVDYISLGCLTHSVAALDISVKVKL